MKKLLIDGYNLLYALEHEGLLKASGHQSLENQREALIEKLLIYQEIKNVQIELVFDSKESPLLIADRSKRRDLKIIYSQHHESADEFMIETAAKKPSTYILISNDRHILREGARLQSLTLTSDEFIQKLKNALKQETQATPFDFDFDDDLIGSKEDDRPLYPKLGQKKKGSPKKLPKKERKRKQALKKI